MVDATRSGVRPRPDAHASGGARLLVIEDGETLRRALESVRARRAVEMRDTGSAAHARALLESWRPDVVVLDCELPGGDGFDLLHEILNTGPTPAVVAVSGRMLPGESFHLAQMGVRSFVSRPVDAEDLARALEQALDTAPDLVPLVRATVGHIGMREIAEQVRRTMVAEALARTRGCRTAAARLLAVSRQLLQYMLKQDT